MHFRLACQLGFLTIFSCIGGTNAQCKVGEPINERSDTAPDLNITISPESDFRVGDKLNVTCTADRPRYQFSGIQPKPPVAVSIFLGNTLVVNQNYGGRNDQERVELAHTIDLTTADNVNVACRTQNSDGTCRVKILEINVKDRAMQKPVSFSTSMPKSSSQSMPSVSSTVNFTSPTSPLPVTKFKLETTSSTMNLAESRASTTSFKLETTPSTINTGGEGGKQGEQKVEDDDEVEDVKHLIIATLILVSMTLILVFVTIIYVLRKASE